MMKKINPRFRRIRKSEESQQVLDFLDEYLEGNIDEPMRWLVRFWQDQAAALTYKELRSIVTDETSPEALFADWFHDYSKLLSERMAPVWEDAFLAGWKNCSVLRDIPDIISSEARVREWIVNRTGELITNCCEEQKSAIQYLIAECRSKSMSSAETARYIRPTIGLTEKQSEANLKLYNSVKEKLREEHPRMSEETIERKARDSAAKYAGKQQRYRAETIARTEVATAYNNGNDEFIREAISQDLMPEMAKEWSTALFDVCPACAALEGMQIDMDGEFSTKSGRREVTTKLPPLHPRCKCAVKYVEVSEDSAIMKLPRLEEAVIPEEKLLSYSLDPDKQPDKARAFKEALGYEKSNYQHLISNIRGRLRNAEAVEKGDNGYGMRYEVKMKLNGVNGKTANVITAWIDDKDNGEMRLTSVYVDKE